MLCSAQQFKHKWLKRCEMSTCISQSLDANVAVWERHWWGCINHNVYIVSTCNCIESSMFDTNVGFTTVYHKVRAVHFSEDGINSRFKHRKQFLICEHLDSIVVLSSDDWWYWTEVHLSCCNDRNIKDFGDLSHSSCIVCHSVEVEYVLCESLLDVTFKKDSVCRR